MQPNKSLTAERIIAILIVVLGGGWMARYSATTDDGWLPVGIAGVLGITALAVGLSVWRASPRALFAYTVWAAADVVGLVLLDALAGEELWKVALGGAAAAAVLTMIGWGLVAARSPRLLASSESSVQ